MSHTSSQSTPRPARPTQSTRRSRLIIAAWTLAAGPLVAALVAITGTAHGHAFKIWLGRTLGAVAFGLAGVARAAKKAETVRRRLGLAAVTVGLVELAVLAWIVFAVVHALRNPPAIPL